MNGQTPNYPTKIKRWYKKWWGVVILIILAIFLIFGSAITFQVAQILWKFNKGEITVEEIIGKSTNDLDEIRKKVESTDDPFLGPKDAPVTIVEFGDFACPITKQMVPVLKQLRELYPQQVKIIYRDYPIVSQDSITAANAAACAYEQGAPIFWTFHDQLFAGQDNLTEDNMVAIAKNMGINTQRFYQCFTARTHQKEIKEDMDTGLNLNLKGTPVFFINGNMVTGLQPIESWKKAIDYLIKQNAIK
ncbi:MAG: thioredoxin domain-containing protein [Patescibacteria group bacterium]|jgi:protein-disulfide isomerase